MDNNNRRIVKNIPAKEVKKGYFFYFIDAFIDSDFVGTAIVLEVLDIKRKDGFLNFILDYGHEFRGVKPEQMVPVVLKTKEVVTEAKDLEKGDIVIVNGVQRVVREVVASGPNSVSIYFYKTPGEGELVFRNILNTDPVVVLKPLM